MVGGTRSASKGAARRTGRPPAGTGGAASSGGPPSPSVTPECYSIWKKWENMVNWICELWREMWDTLALNTCLLKFLKQCMVFGFLEVNSVRKKWKIYLNFKIPEIFGFLDLGLSLEPDTWLYLFGHEISQTQPMWGHTQNFSSFGPLILHLLGVRGEG